MPADVANKHNCCCLIMFSRRTQIYMERTHQRRTFVKSIQGGATIGPDLTEAQHSWRVMLEFMTNRSKVLHFLWHSFCSEQGQPRLSAMQLLVLKKGQMSQAALLPAPLGGGIVLARKPSVPTGIEWQGFIRSYRQMWVKCDKTWKSVLEIKICTDHNRCSCYGGVRMLQTEGRTDCRVYS